MVPLTQAEVSTLQRADSQSGYANVSVLSGRPTPYKQAAALTRGDAARTALLPRSHLVKLGSFSLSRLIASVAVREFPNPIARLGVYRHEAAVSWQEHRVQLPRRRERETPGNRDKPPVVPPWSPGPSPAASPATVERERVLKLT